MSLRNATDGVIAQYVTCVGKVWKLLIYVPHSHCAWELDKVKNGTTLCDGGQRIVEAMINQEQTKLADGTDADSEQWI